MEKLSHKRVCELLDYEPASGVFVWRVDRGAGARCGDVAGRVRFDGRYRTITVDRKSYLEHRLIWFWVHGEWPPNTVDHVNGDGLDNRLHNLRLATLSENQGNRKRSKNNTTGYKGVAKCRNKYKVFVGHEGARFHIGVFENLEEARAAYAQAANILKGEFSKTG